MGKLKEQCNELAVKLSKIEATFELECYRAEARVRKQWEAHEDRLVQQLKELQHQRRVQEEHITLTPFTEVKQTKDILMNPSHIDQRKSLQCSASQSTKGVQWVENMPGEEPTMPRGMVNKPAGGSLEPSVPLVVDNTVAHGVFNSRTLVTCTQ